MEKRNHLPDSPRAFLINPRSMELMRRSGLEEAMQLASYPRYQSTKLTVASTMLHKRPALSLDLGSWGKQMDGVKSKRLFGTDTNVTVCPPLLCPQFTQESVLAKHLKEKCPQNSILWNTEALSLTQDENGVTVRMRSVEDGSEKS